MEPPKLNLGKLEITSTAFTHGGRIPDEFADFDHPVAPPLAWSAPPAGTASFALVMHDPDAPLTYGFTHWVLYGIPASVSSLTDHGAAYTAGSNSLGQHGYLAPLPPVGRTHHHYFFDLYALDVGVDLRPGLSRDELLAAIDGHIIEQDRIVGTYSR